ncbi:MAG: hypothetical protein QNI99_05085 [Woeseiaceae bacterium]|nr:hypothetical protein [Woeseiaceae bacterium]
MSPKLFIGLLGIIAIAWVLVPWFKGIRRESRLPPDKPQDDYEMHQRLKRDLEYESDGRPRPRLENAKDVAGEAFDAGGDAGGGD